MAAASGPERARSSPGFDLAEAVFSLSLLVSSLKHLCLPVAPAQSLAPPAFQLFPLPKHSRARQASDGGQAGSGGAEATLCAKRPVASLGIRSARL